MIFAGGRRSIAGAVRVKSINFRAAAIAAKLSRRVFRLPVCMVLLSVFTSAVSAGTFTVYGPQVIQRVSGSPSVETYNFSVLDPSAEYTLNVYNGGIEDDEVTGDLVSSGYLNINAVEIIGAQNFNQNVTTLAESVTLSLQNEITVELRGKPGGVITIDIVGIDNTPPTITASVDPAAGANGWHTSAVTVSFDCSDATSGIQSCPDPIVVHTDGAGQVISATATDNAGNTESASVTLNIDTTAPVLSFQAPIANSSLQTTTPAIDVAYGDNIAVDASSLQFTANGAVLSVSCQGTAGGALCTPGASLPEGTVTLTGSIQDSAGNTGTGQVLFEIVTDSDGDGVNDADDQCPGTPTGESVDADGCAPSQLDADGDGISDALDQCPGTPIGETPYPDGCAPSQFDSDGDGVFDANDICPNTVAGEPVDAHGCSYLQQDDDGDGLNNEDDECPATPAGESTDATGCSSSQVDTDGDGVSDAADQCPATPAGEQADAVGCGPSERDSDTDGISDAADLCPGTLAGSANNSDGCAAYQLDSDGDGVTDDIDLFPNDATETVDLDGDGIGDNSDQDRDGDGVDNTADVFPDDPAEWSDLDGDGIGDNADTDRDGDGVNNDDDFFPDDPSASTVPTVTITSPATLTTVGASPIQVSGTINDPAAVLTLNGIQISHSGGVFQGNVVITEGHNAIIARAVDTQGHEGVATVSISLDMTPPYVTVESPLDGQVVRSASIAVTGLVNDIVRGTVADSQAVVTVNGIQAAVSNRSYLAENISLAQGGNAIVVTASDNVGNTASKVINISYEPVTGASIEPVGGQGQNATIRTILSQPLSVRLLDENNTPVANKNVVFRVIQGDGQLQDGTNESQGVLVITDAQGVAGASFRLGYRAGDGIHKVRAKAVGFDGEVVFYASALPNLGNKVNVIAGNNQRGAIKQPLPEPFTVAVSDEGANLVPNSQVEFRVTQGDGKFSDDSQSQIVTTDSDGRASAQFILGSDQGLDVQAVTATLLGSDLYAGFTASGFLPGDPGQTAVSGVVLDNQDTPVPGVTVRIDGTTRQAVSDAAGLFTITQVPVGPLHLVADGSTATVAGEWPNLSYNIVTVAGVDNPLAAPIYMVKLDTANKMTVGAADVDYTLPEIPGFKLKVKAGSVTFPDGSSVGDISVTAVNANKVPMPPPNGMQPQFIVTIQPTGAAFDPPAELTLPNVDGHLPGAQVEMYSYDHDLEEFVTIGLGTVSKDGSIIKSNPGVGVIKAGWHCGSQPDGSGCTHNCKNYCDECNADCNCILVPKRPLEVQQPDDCRLNYCDGTWTAQVETPSIPDEAEDCHRPECVDGNPELVVDVNDIPQDIAGDCRKTSCTASGQRSTFEVDDTDKPSYPNGDCCEGYRFSNKDTCCESGNMISKYNIFDLDDCPNRVPRTGYTPTGGPCTSPVGSSPSGTDFSPACDLHDICYGTCNSNQSSCDIGIRDNTQNICFSTWVSGGVVTNEDAFASCLHWSTLFYEAVSLLGGEYWEDGQKEGCQCCP